MRDTPLPPKTSVPARLQSVNVREWKGLRSWTHEIWEAFLALLSTDDAKEMEQHKFGKAMQIIAQYAHKQLQHRVQVRFLQGHDIVYTEYGTSSISKVEHKNCLLALWMALHQPQREPPSALLSSQTSGEEEAEEDCPSGEEEGHPTGEDTVWYDTAVVAKDVEDTLKMAAAAGVDAFGVTQCPLSPEERLQVPRFGPPRSGTLSMGTLAQLRPLLGWTVSQVTLQDHCLVANLALRLDGWDPAWVVRPPVTPGRRGPNSYAPAAVPLLSRAAEVVVVLRARDSGLPQRLLSLWR